MKQIPIYRGLRLGTEDEYVVGDLIKKIGWFFIAIQDTIDSNNAYDLLTFVDNGNIFEIDKSTLAIHFPDMLDSQGNKIFASLSEDGKGGDICSPDGIEVYFCVQDGCTFLKNDEWEKEISRVAYNAFKVIGIQQ